MTGRRRASRLATTVMLLRDSPWVSRFYSFHDRPNPHLGSSLQFDRVIQRRGSRREKSRPGLDRTRFGDRLYVKLIALLRILLDPKPLSGGRLLTGLPFDDKLHQLRGGRSYAEGANPLVQGSLNAACGQCQLSIYTFASSPDLIMSKFYAFALLPPS